MKRIAVIVGYLALYLVVLTGVGELYLYIRGFQPDTDLVRDYYGIAASWHRGRFRAERPMVLRPRAPKKVLVLGCSFTYGQGVEREDTYIWKINQQQSEYHLRNCGIIGEGISTALLQLPELLKREHYDMVLYAAIANHAHREWDLSMVLDSQPPRLARREALQYMYTTERPIYINGTLHRLVMFWCHKVWPGENISRLVYFAHKAWLDQTYPKPLDRVSNATQGEYRLRYGLRSCYTICHRNNLPFAVVELFGFNHKNECNPAGAGPYCKQPLEYFVNTPFGPDDVVPPIPIIKAEYPTDILTRPELNTKPSSTDPGGHPTPVVHSYYANKILAGIRAIEAQSAKQQSH